MNGGYRSLVSSWTVQRLDNVHFHAHTHTRHCTYQLLHNHWQLWSAHFNSVCLCVYVIVYMEVKICFHCGDLAKVTLELPGHAEYAQRTLSLTYSNNHNVWRFEYIKNIGSHFSVFWIWIKVITACCCLAQLTGSVFDNADQDGSC